MRAVFDTSVFIADESGRSLDDLPGDLEVAVSVITIAELRLGVLRAGDGETRDQRLATYARALVLDALPVDVRVAEAFARLVSGLRDLDEKAGIQDTWIAATAAAHGAAVVTRDRGFRVFARLGTPIIDV